MAAVTLMRTPAETALVEAFEGAKAALPGEASFREEAFRQFAERGLPHRRVEDFKYTDLRAALREAAPFAARPTPAEAQAALWEGEAFRDLDTAAVAIVNGHFVREVSTLERLPAGVEVVPLRDALAEGHPLLSHLMPVAFARENPVYQLNTAFMADGAVIRVSGEVERPLHLRFVTAGSSPLASATRILVVVEEGARVTLLETHESSDTVGHQPNDVVEIVAGDRAVVQHVRLNLEGSGALALSTLAARLGAHASLTTLNAVVGSAMARHQVFLSFAGEHATAQVNGTAMIKGRQHADTTLSLIHI